MFLVVGRVRSTFRLDSLAMIRALEATATPPFVLAAFEEARSISGFQLQCRELEGGLDWTGMVGYC